MESGYTTYFMSTIRSKLPLVLIFDSELAKSFTDLTVSRIQPIEEAYSLLNRFELNFNDGNVERVDSIGYAWKNVQQQATEVQNTLMEVQPTFKENLNLGVAKFKDDTSKFYADFDSEGPLVRVFARFINIVNFFCKIVTFV